MKSLASFERSYLIYTRKSTDDADNQKNSIAYQKQEALKYAKQHNLKIAEFSMENFCTNGVITERHTGYKEGSQFKINKAGVQHTIQRPKFHLLVEQLWNNSFKGVIFLCWDRASRNKSDNTILHRLLDHGKDIRFVQASYDTSSAGMLHMDIDGMFAQHYSRIISEKVRNTTTKLRSEGIYTSLAPIGYLNTGDPKNRPLDPVRAPIVKQLFELYAQGSWSLSDLARYANEQGLTMPARKRKRTPEEMLKDDEVVLTPIERVITVNQIHSMLRNPFYIGKLRGPRNTTITSICHTPLIDEETFERVQRMLQGKRVSQYYTKKIYYPYRGLIRCNSCSRVYTPYEQKGIHYYGARCVKDCLNTKRSINAHFIEQQVGNLIETIYYCDTEMTAISSYLKEGNSKNKEYQEQEIAHLVNKQRKVHEELAYIKDNKLTLLKTGTYTPEEYRIEVDRLKLRLEEIAEAINSSYASLNEVTRELVGLSELLKNSYKHYLFGNPTEKREIINCVFSELKLNGTNLNFQCKNGFELLADHSFVYGARKTRISELEKMKTLIGLSIQELNQLTIIAVILLPPNLVLLP